MVLDGAALDRELHGEASDPRAYLVRFGYEPPPLYEIAEARALAVEVNAGRWIWLCPCDDGSTEQIPRGGGVAFKSSPLGWCPRCGNASVGGGWRPLAFPVESAAIEAVLALRPDAATRNWWPGETVDELRAENRLHGFEDGGAQ